MRIILLAILIILIFETAETFAIRCYFGSGLKLRTDTTEKVSKYDKYCSKAYFPCSSNKFTCSSEELNADISKWVYFSTDTLNPLYPNNNQTICTTPLCNEPVNLPTDGFWCYSGQGFYGPQNYELVYVSNGTDKYCSHYENKCSSLDQYCSDNKLSIGMTYHISTVTLEQDCENYKHYPYVDNFTCCKGEKCNKPPTIKCYNGISNSELKAVDVKESPYDENTYSCYNDKVCANADCDRRFRYGYMNKTDCSALTNCCYYDGCNRPKTCYVGMSPETAQLKPMIQDSSNDEMYCGTFPRNCSIVQQDCSPNEIAQGVSKPYFTFAQFFSEECKTGSCCYDENCNKPYSIDCYNSTNINNSTQPDTFKSIELYGINNCARHSYACSNPIWKKYCTANEISKSVVKTIYYTATDSECATAQNEYFNYLDPICCKSSKCNEYQPLKGNLTCYIGDFASGEGMPRNSFITLPSAGSYNCYRRSYTCTTVSSKCTLANVNAKTVRYEYGVVLSSNCNGYYYCCATGFCNKYNALIDPVASTPNNGGGGGNGGGSGGGGGAATSTKGKTSTRLNDSSSMSKIFSLCWSVMMLLCLSL